MHLFDSFELKIHLDWEKLLIILCIDITPREQSQIVISVENLGLAQDIFLKKTYID